MTHTRLFFCLLAGLTNFLFQEVEAQSVESWKTSADQSKLFAKQGNNHFINGEGSSNAKININETVRYQIVEGFGWTMTQGSAYWIMQLSESEQNALLEDLFSVSKGFGSATLRIAVGASDLGQGAYTYRDDQAKLFSLAGPDKEYLIPVLKKIIRINPDIQLLATPWSAPAWMKTNNSLQGGELKTGYYDDYAGYLIDYFQAMHDQGIEIQSVTIQNEPLNGNNLPSMYMTKEAQYNFVNDYLGPALEQSNFNRIRLIAYDHNCDNTEYPVYVAQSKYIEGAAFHLYGGNIDAMKTVYDQTNKSVYFTEQWTSSSGNFSGDFPWHIKNVMFGSMQNRGKTALAWNVASNENWEPHTTGGCNNCKGAITINSNSKAITKNVTYYTVAQFSKVTRKGSVLLATTAANAGDLYHAAFSNPDGSFSLVVFNNEGNNKTFDIQWNGKSCPYTLEGNTLASLIWEPLEITTPATSVSVSPGSATIQEKQIIQLTATVEPDNATQKTVCWESSNENIATVDANGLVTGRRAGTVTITATTVNGKKTASCNLIVTVNTSDAGMFPHIYNIISVHSNKALDLKDGNKEAGASVQQWELDGTGGNDNQRWIPEYAGNSIYYIQSKSSGLYLQAMGSSNDAKIQQQVFTGNENQEWKIAEIEDGIFSIKSVFAGTAIDVAGPSTNNGAEVHLWTYGGGNNQKWRFEEAEKITTGIGMIPEILAFSIFPNPTGGILTFYSDSQDKWTYNLYSFSGRSLRSGNLNQHTNEINLIDFKSGIYVLKMQSENNRISQKVIKK
jgi:glucosylceramidase